MKAANTMTLKTHFIQGKQRKRNQYHFRAVVFTNTITSISVTLTQTNHRTRSSTIDRSMTTDNLILVAKAHLKLKMSDCTDEVEVEAYLPTAVAVAAASCLAILEVRRFLAFIKVKSFRLSIVQTRLWRYRQAVSRSIGARMRGTLSGRKIWFSQLVATSTLAQLPSSSLRRVRVDILSLIILVMEHLAGRSSASNLILPAVIKMSIKGRWLPQSTSCSSSNRTLMQ